MRLSSSSGVSLLLAAVARRSPPPALTAADAPLAHEPWGHARLLEELALPVFAILLEDEEKLYGDERLGGGTLVYCALSDASTVLTQLQSTFPDQSFALRPLQLGTVLHQSGMLGTSLAVRSANQLPVVLVASRSDQREAKKLGWACTSEKGLASVPLFEIGTLESKLPEGGSEALWPLFFRYEDAQATWDAFSGGGGPMPKPRVTHLGKFMDCVRSTMPLPGRPSLCGPLDSIEYCSRHNPPPVSGSEDIL